MEKLLLWMFATLPNSWLELALLALAIYRIARMITVEDGPFGIFSKLRDWVFAHFDETHWINRGFSCPYCVGFWLALGALFLPDALLWWFGAAGLVSLIFAWEFRG